MARGAGDGREGAVDDLVDGVDGLSFAGTAAENKNARDEVVVHIICVVKRVRLRIPLHDESRNADGFATTAAENSAEILSHCLCCHGDCSFGVETSSL